MFFSAFRSARYKLQRIIGPRTCETQSRVWEQSQARELAFGEEGKGRGVRLMSTAKTRRLRGLMEKATPI